MNNKVKLRIGIKICELSIFVLSLVCVNMYNENKIQQIESKHVTETYQLQQEVAMAQKDAQVYQIMYSVTEKQVNGYKTERDEAVSKYNYIQEQIKYSKLAYGTPNRGDYANKSLTQYPIVTIDDMNDYISRISPNDSPFIGQGEIFLKASKETGLDPKYIFSHSAVESGYGASSIAVEKGNYYGIGAFNNDPNQAYHMGSDLEDGIINGAMWIKKNYTNKGYDTLSKMVYQGSYCLTDSGEPSQKWVDDIAYIATK